MIERPIILHAHEVRGVLAGTQTQVRRVIKPQPKIGAATIADLQQHRPGLSISEIVNEAWQDGFVKVRCPYGEPGLRLWVRETWAHYQTVNRARLAHGGTIGDVSDGLAGYRADGFDSIEDFRKHILAMAGSLAGLEAVEIRGDCWRPSTNMPRWASRLTLEVSEVRVQRLAEISCGDAIAEGCTELASADAWGEAEWRAWIEYGTSSIDVFRRLWDSINGDRPGCAWGDSPWVWAITFARVMP